MFANVKTLVVVAACALVAQALGSPSAAALASLSSSPVIFDSCTLECVSDAAANAGCPSYIDLPCVCASTAFQNDALQCLQSNCTAQDATSLEQIMNQQCATPIGSNNSSVPASTPASTATPTRTSTPPTPSPRPPALTASNCTAQDVAYVSQLQSQLCPTTTAGSGNSSIPASTLATSTHTSTATSTGTSAPSTPTSAAVGLAAPFTFEGVFSTLIALASALVGAAFVL
ncbi:hypothetical protein BU15DRAFT_77421 [Melanogaster broomeanus]|nr:hypothetical protein BU15DRAFT_77421 [Melanogaster broomeanus]